MNLPLRRTKHHFDFDHISDFCDDRSLETISVENELPDSVWQSYSAFANTRGGTILLGVEQSAKREFRICGVQDPISLIKQFWDTVNDPSKISGVVLFEENVYTQLVDGKSVVVIEVPQAQRTEKPIYINNSLNNGTYIRKGEGDFVCNKEKLLSMVRDASVDSLDLKVLNDLDESAFDSATIHAYRNILNSIKPNHVWRPLDDPAFLVRIGAAAFGKDGRVHPTAAGLLMFGEEYQIRQEFPRYFLDYQEHLIPEVSYSDRIISYSGDWSGNVFDFFTIVMNRLSKFIPNPFILKGAMRDEKPLYRAVREALLNCLVNADFYGRGGLVVSCDGEAVFFRNPGKFRLDLDVARDGGLSDPRNAGLLRFFTFIGFAENMGSGIQRIYSMWGKAKLPQPIYEVSDDPEYVKLTLSFKIDYNFEDTIEHPLNGDDDQRSNEISTTLESPYSKNEEHLFKMFRNDDHNDEAFMQ